LAGESLVNLKKTIKKITNKTGFLMNPFSFIKMHGAGNDFIVAADFDLNWPRTPQFIKLICNRQRGIGADGLILISSSGSKQHSDKNVPLFKMDFYNCDGNAADMCGNGLRCAGQYAYKYLTENNSNRMLFETGAGVLEVVILQERKVQIQIPLVRGPEKIDIDNCTCFIANTGVPHLVIPLESGLETMKVEKEGEHYRNLQLFQPEGTNVDFVCVPDSPENPVAIRTFERGVERETSACGTGIAAAAVALAKYSGLTPPIDFITKNRDIISVDFCYNENIVEGFQDLVLIGPVEEVFGGTYLEVLKV